MKRIILCVLFTLPLLVSSQIKLKGTVINNNLPIEWVNVVLINTNGEITTGSITDNNGNFSLSAKKNTYTLSISFMGYTTWTKEIVLEKNLDLEKIILKEDSNTLDEVVLIKRKNIIEQKADRIIFNVENSLAATGGDALDALKLAPGLKIQNNSIGMLGRNEASVMANGRILPLSGEELITYLNSIPSDAIKKIEIITTPPAKYEASGNGGLINIVLKKGIRDSWKNTTTVIYNQDNYNYTSLRNNLLYNKKKLSLSLGLDGALGNIKGDENFQVYYPESTWDIDIDTKDKKDNLAARLLLDYDVTKKTTIGIQYLGYTKNPGIEDTSTSKIYNQNNILDSLLINNGKENVDTKSQSINLHSITELDTLGKNISFDFDYFSYNSDRNRNFKTDTYNINNEFTGINSAANTISNQGIKNYSAKVDIEHPLTFLNLTYGAKITKTESNSEILFFNTITSTPEYDPTISNSFKYNENNQMFYISSTKQINDNWNLKLGLRLENTQTKGYSVNLNQTNKNKYAKLFPTFYASYKKDENNSLSFSYSKRIRRPRFHNLNPFRVYISSNTYSEGNPFLQPSFYDNFEFKHTYKNNLTTNVFLNIENDGLNVIFRSNVENSTQIVTRENYYKQYIYGLGESFMYNKIAWWQSQNSLSLIGSKTEFIKDIEATPQNGITFSASTNNTFIINETTKLQVNASYDSPFKAGLFSLGEMYSLDIGASKHFFNKSLQASILFKDIFNTSSLNNYKSTVSSVKQVYGQSRNNKYFRFSLSYNFGNSNINTKRRSFGNEEETRRAN